MPAAPDATRCAWPGCRIAGRHVVDDAVGKRWVCDVHRDYYPTGGGDL